MTATKPSLIKNRSSKAAVKSFQKMQWLMNINVAKALGWHVWVAEVMVEMSKFCDNVECTSGYRVIKSGTRYEIIFECTKPFGKMDASQIYDWSNRLPLSWMQKQADSFRTDLYANCN
jgi:hypothetical protein